MIGENRFCKLEHIAANRAGLRTRQSLPVRAATSFRAATVRERLLGRTSRRPRITEAGVSALVLATIMLLTAAPAWPHHAFAAEFDAKKPIELHGTVTKMEWINPHAWIYIDVTGPDGKTESWAIEAGTPNTLFRRGFTKDSLKAGTEIVVNGYRAKDGSNRVNGKDVTFPDGRRLFLGTSGTGAPYDQEIK